MANLIFLDLAPEASVSEWNLDHIKSIVDQICQTMKMIDHEDYNGYYTPSHLKDIYERIKIIDPRLATQILLYFKSWSDCKSLSTKINENQHIIVEESISDVFIANRHRSLYTYLSVDKETKPILINENHRTKQVIKPVAFEEISLYRWFVENRNPQRSLDPNYKKHSRFNEHIGKSGNVISKWTYKDEEASTMLKHAVYSKDSKRLILHHKDDKKILVFFNQNQSSPTYHAYQIEQDNNSELSKFTNESLKKMRKVPFSTKQ